MELTTLYRGIGVGPDGGGDNYLARQIPRFAGHFVARSLNSPAVLLPTVSDATDFRSPLEFENLSVRFGARCVVVDGDARVTGTFTIIRCLSADVTVQDYFLYIVEKLLLMLGPMAGAAEIEREINRLIDLFRQLGRPPLRGAAGLFGELLVMLHSSDALAAVTAWRIDDDDRFDFVSQDGRLEVKTSGTRRRMHEFSYEQCMLPGSTIGILVSMFVEQIGGGSGIHEIARRIEDRLTTRPDLASKLYLNIARTLGSELAAGLRLRFDERLASNSIKYFFLASIPAVRGPLPPEISGVRFRSALEGVASVGVEDILAASCGDLRALLPHH